MTEAQTAVEEQADALLKPYKDCFSEATLSRQTRRQRPLAMRYYATLQHIEDYSQFKTDCWRVLLECAKRQRVNSQTCSYLNYLSQGMSYRQIAQLCNVDHHTVKSHINAAADKIRLDPYYDLYEVIAEEFRLKVEQVKQYCRSLMAE